MRWAVIAALSLLLQGTTGAPAPAQKKASIEGVVVRAGTEEPIAGVEVTLGPAVRGNTSEDALAQAYTALNALQNAATTTDSDGKFSFNNVEPGSYGLGVAADRYVRRVVDRFSSQFTLVAGQSLKDLTIPMTPTGSISGRIHDQFGRPAVGTMVQLLRASYNANGQKTFQSAGAARTDDRGEYRLYWVTPGRYLLAAGNEAGPTTRGGGLAGSSPASPNEDTNTVYAMTYYPGVPDATLAGKVEVTAGSDIAAIDWSCVRLTSFRNVRGRVIDARTGQPPAGIQLNLGYRRLAGGTGSMGVTSNYNAATGAFEIRNLVPGGYAIQTQSSEGPSRGGPGAASTAAAAGATPGQTLPVRLFTSTEITVGITDLEGVLVTLSEPQSIAGRVSVDSSASALDLTKVSVNVRGLSSYPRSNPAPGTMTQSQATTAAGTFRIDGIQPGSYELVVRSPGAYVKSARFDGIDVLQALFQVAGPVSGTLDIVVGAGVGKISGTVSDDKALRIEGAQVVLIPEQRSRNNLYQNVTTGPDGDFKFVNVAPGDYRVFAWGATTIEAYSWFDPDVMERFELQGMRVHLAEGGNESVDARVIQ